MQGGDSLVLFDRQRRLVLTGEPKLLAHSRVPGEEHYPKGTEFVTTDSPPAFSIGIKLNQTLYGKEREGKLLDAGSDFPLVSKNIAGTFPFLNPRQLTVKTFLSWQTSP